MTAQQANDAFATDAQAMARAGYVPLSQSWGSGAASGLAVATFGIAGLGIQGAGVLTVSYSYRPDLTGPPSSPIPLVPDPTRGPEWKLPS